MRKATYAILILNVVSLFICTLIFFILGASQSPWYFLAAGGSLLNSFVFWGLATTIGDVRRIAKHLNVELDSLKDDDDDKSAGAVV